MILTEKYNIGKSRFKHLYLEINRAFFRLLLSSIMGSGHHHHLLLLFSSLRLLIIRQLSCLNAWLVCRLLPPSLSWQATCTAHGQVAYQ